MNLGQMFDKFLKTKQESFPFSFSKLFADDLCKGELICLRVPGGPSPDRRGRWVPCGPPLA